jgi:type II secretory pathway pseudopilin PulG
MKTKGFTILELVLAATLLLILSTVATTSTFNFIQATANLKAQSNSIQNIMLLSGVLANAKLNYATDLALIIAAGTTGNPSPQQIQQAGQAQIDITAWNTAAQQFNNAQLIYLLINPNSANPDSALPIPLVPLTPGSTSYLPTSHVVQVVTYNNGNPVTTSVTVQITDITSLLKAYQLTDDGTPTGNIVATISVGPIVQVTSTGFRPTLPIIDWKSGTTQEIQY